MFITDYVANTKYKQISVIDYADYLEKEGLIQEKIQGESSRQLSAYLDKQNDKVRVEGKEYFFNGTGNTYDSEDVTKTIDSNVRGLKKSEARYFTFSVSPSRQEILHLRRMIADTQQALRDSGEILPESYSDDMMRAYLKEYGVKCMDAYAQNFGHEKLRDNRDLLWFGMVEKERYWKPKDKEVKHNADIDRKIEALKNKSGKGMLKEEDTQRKIASVEKRYIRECDVRSGGSKEILRPMMPKSGDNWHIHVTVSRRDRTNSFNLSPQANGRGSKNHQLKGESVRVGFNREAHKINCEKIFDSTFAHERLQSESYEQAKALRKQSAFVFEKQRLRDQATRRAEDMEFAQMKAAGYKEYYENLIASERLEARHLAQLKRHIATQVKHLNPKVDVEQLMKQDLSELQEQFGQLEQEDGSIQIDGLAASAGDKVLQATGLPVYRPISMTRKVLRRGIAINKAIDLRRQVYDQWCGIYTDNWNKQNYFFDSIANHRNTECFFAQTEYLENEFGESVLLRNAQDHLKRIEREFAAGFLKENWAEHMQDTVSHYALEVFGPEGASVRTLGQLHEMARERLLPLDATRCMEGAVRRCAQPQDIAGLRQQIAGLQSERVAALTQKLDTTLSDRGLGIEALAGILNNKDLAAPAKEEALLRLAADLRSLQKELGPLLVPEQAEALAQKLETLMVDRGPMVTSVAHIIGDNSVALETKEALLAQLSQQGRALDNALRDLRAGLVKILEQKNPGMKYNALKERLDKLFNETLKDIKINRQAELAKVLDEHIKFSLPDYCPVIEKQSELEQLIKEITPDKEKCAERLIEVNDAVSRQLSPYAEQLFEQNSQRLFGPEVRLRNEHDFCDYLEKNCSGEQAERFRGSLDKLYAKIEERRQQIIQGIVRELPRDEMATIRRQQNHINRYINRTFDPQTAKSKKEELQRTVAASCRRRITPEAQYKVLDHFTQKQIAAQAMQKASMVKMPSISPQQLAIKAAFKLVNVLTKGY